MDMGTPDSLFFAIRTPNSSTTLFTGLGALISMWFVLQADIEEAKKLPEPTAPEITRMEFDMKDKLVRQTIMTTQEDVTEIKEDIKRIEEKIDQLK